MNTGSGSPPRWDMAAVYSGVDSPGFQQDLSAYRRLVQQLIQDIDAESRADGGARSGDGAADAAVAAAARLYAIITTMNRCRQLIENLESYVYCCFATASDNPDYVKALNRIEHESLAFQDAAVRFRNLAAASAAHPHQRQGLYRSEPRLEQYDFFLAEQAEYQRTQLSPGEEQLAADLQRSGAEAWSRLQEQISSTLQVAWPNRGDNRSDNRSDDPRDKKSDDASGATRTVVQLRNMAHDRDRSVRERAFYAELDAWKSMEIPLAAALNGVKGTSGVLAKRRGYASQLEPALQQSRISRKSLDALVGAMQRSLPRFQAYLQAKADYLGLERLAFYDILAPLETAPQQWGFADARAFIQREFTAFSPELGSFAGHAFDSGWIDAEPRPGKVGGGFCIDLPHSGVSRILCNFEGSFSDVSTVAHELGHAWHSSLLRDQPAVLSEYPMTLAETASIFCETLIFESRLQQLPQAQCLPIIEHFLQETTQMVVDILSRFLFEQELCERRQQGELSPQELCDIMLQAQHDCYGSVLDPATLHPYMWAVKGHYYIPSLSFYNFPYAFGLLFALGLFRQYQSDPEGFPERYRRILQASGSMPAGDVAAMAGVSIESPEFWESSLNLIGDYIDQFIDLGGNKK